MKPSEFKIGDEVVFRDGEISFSGVVTEVRREDIRIRDKNGIEPLVSTESFDGRPYVILKQRKLKSLKKFVLCQ